MPLIAWWIYQDQLTDKHFADITCYNSTIWSWSNYFYQKIQNHVSPQKLWPTGSQIQKNVIVLISPQTKANDCLMTEDTIWENNGIFLIEQFSKRFLENSHSPFIWHYFRKCLYFKKMKLFYNILFYFIDLTCAIERRGLTEITPWSIISTSTRSNRVDLPPQEKYLSTPEIGWTDILQEEHSNSDNIQTYRIIEKKVKLSSMVQIPKKELNREFKIIIKMSNSNILKHVEIDRFKYSH